MNFLRRVMYGRYGGDQLSLFTLVVYLLLNLTGAALSWFAPYPVALAFQAAALLLGALTLYRMLSRNIVRRRRENEKFLSLTAPIRGWLHTRKMIRSDKEHRYFKCPQCHQQLRVPRGKGKLKITCRACGASFEKRS